MSYETPAVQPTFEIPARELRAFQELADDIVANTRRDMTSVVEQAAVYFCQSAGKLSPMAGKRRKVFANPQRKGRGKNATGAKYRFRVYTQSKTFWMYTDDRMDARRTIGYAGALRNTWRGMIRTFSRKSSGKTLGTGGGDIRKLMAAISGRFTGKGADNPTVTMQNRLSYLLTVTPNVGEQAMQKVLARMNKQLEIRKKKMEDTWNNS
jgi:hypothetical protein